MTITTSLLSSFQTTAALNAFMPMPAQGTIYVPGSYVGTHEPAVVLNNGNAEPLLNTVDHLMEEARQIFAEQERWNLGGGLPLVETDMAWEINSFPQWEVSSFQEEYDEAGQSEGLYLKGPRGRILRFDRRAEGLQIGVGYGGALRNSNAWQTVFIDKAHEVWTSHYALDFFWGGVAGIRHFLQLPDAALVDVGAHLTSLIYSAHPYQSAALGAPQLMNGSPTAHPLMRAPSAWRLPQLDAGIDLRTFSIETAAQVPIVATVQRTQPIIEISGETTFQPKDPSVTPDQHLSVLLRRPHWQQKGARSLSPTLGLSGKLLEIWRGARLWALQSGQ